MLSLSKHPPLTFTTTPPTAWIIEAYTQNGILVQNVSINNPNSTSSTISSLDSGFMYMVRVAGVNTRGIGNYSEFVTRQTYKGTERIVL